MALTLTIEDGTGVAGSNTYVSQANAIIYAANWGNIAFSNASSQSQINALYYGTYALDRLYGRKYISVVPPTSTQGLLWPRYTIMGNDFRMVTQGQIPQCLADATCELANMYLQGTSLFPNQTTNRLYKTSNVKLEELSVNNEYWKIPDDVEHYDGFRKVELILWPIIEMENNNGARMTL